MDKVIEAARELGRVLQSDERYVRYINSQEASDKDPELGKMIDEFQNKRFELSGEIQKKDKDPGEIARLDHEMKEMYNAIFENPRMVEFNEAKKDIDYVVGFVNQIITAASNGLNPDTVEYQDPSSCSGSCSSCAGCA